MKCHIHTGKILDCAETKSFIKKKHYKSSKFDQKPRLPLGRAIDVSINNDMSFDKTMCVGNMCHHALLKWIQHSQHVFTLRHSCLFLAGCLTLEGNLLTFSDI